MPKGSLPLVCYMRRKDFINNLDLEDLVRTLDFKRKFRKENPDYFYPEGLTIFCGGQGSGKTYSAVKYVLDLIRKYPKSKLVTNVDILGLPEDYEVIEYNGMESLTGVNNGQLGVIFLIDEIHLEFNSLESKNIDIDVMVEVSQQRKQRKHIVGTSQVYMRLAKPFREQINTVVICTNYFHLIQNNVVIDGDTIVEKDGHITGRGKKRWFLIHSSAIYKSYDTYAKMRRYNNLWKGHRRTEKWGNWQ